MERGPASGEPRVHHLMAPSHCLNSVISSFEFDRGMRTAASTSGQVVQGQAHCENGAEGELLSSSASSSAPSRVEPETRDALSSSEG